MDRQAELGEFLRSRRAGLRPEDVGLRDYGGRRRVPGLRREELAQLAGVSIAYYTRLEQGQSQNASDGVLNALASALRLCETERTYLHGLARPERPTRRRSRPERLRPTVRHMIDSFDPVPAMVIGRYTDVLAWNRTAHALIAGHLDFTAPQRPAERPNMARLVFLDPHMRELYVDWERKANDTVGYLRFAASQYSYEPQLSTLIGDLTMHSSDFATLWAAHPVSTCTNTARDYYHPLVGQISVVEEVMTLQSEQDQRVVVLGTEPGSSSEAALGLLNGAPTAEPVPDAQRV